ncbi:MAG: MarR family winged helix-turn-helix transcriptional regulator [Actinomycetota bacterium]
METIRRNELRTEAGMLLFQCMFQAKSHFHKTVGDQELTPPIAGALLLLDEPMPMSELADRIGCDPSYVTGIADRLEELGLAERQPWPSDRRVKQLVVTQEGRRTMGDLARSAFQSNPLLESLSEDDLRNLVEILARAMARDG